MKTRIFKKFCSLLALAIVPFSTISFEDADIVGLFSSSNPKNKIGSDQVNDINGVATNPTQYVGYGYNVAGGKALYEPDALMLNNPILDIDNAAIKNNIKVFDGSKTEYRNNSSTKVSEIAEDYGKVLGGGGAIGGKISAVNVDINAKFNKSATSGWSKVSNEEYSYYSIFSGNRPVVLQMEHADLSNYLSPRFKQDLLSIKASEGATEEINLDALNLFNKYGTHLLTGYTLGGIFEMTNYYATNSDTYTKENTTGFGAQVGMALGSFANGNLNFSFTNNYGYKDNNQFATNQYKCTTYGGLAFPGLTIDQAFSWYETITGAGYIYQLWTDSINAGRNLVIVGVPQSSKMVPLWDLLPCNGDQEISNIKTALMKTYHKITDKSYTKFKNKYQDKYIAGLDNDLNIDDTLEFVDNGYYCSSLVGNNDYLTSYIEPKKNDVDVAKVKIGSTIYMNYQAANFVGEHHEWTVSGLGKNCVNILDKYNGVFFIESEPDYPSAPFEVSFKANGQTKFTRKFSIKTDLFTGGDGTENSPYLIATPEEFITFASDPAYWDGGVYFKLVNDINLKGYKVPLIGGGNTKDSKYNGIFDGNYHTLKNVDLDSTYKARTLFFHNTGEIKDLTIDYANTSQININDGSSFVAGVAALNSSTGKIVNCHVKNFNFNLENGTTSQVVEIEDNISPAGYNPSISVGGICGYNSGLIENCSVSNSKMSVIAHGDNHKQILIGGLVGNSNKNNSGLTTTLSSSYTNGVAISAQNYKNIKSTKDDINEMFVGGLVGSATFTNINNCLVKNMPNFDNNSHKFSIYNYIENGLAYIGGFIGLCSNNVDIANSIYCDNNSIRNINTQDIDKQGPKTFASLFIGKVNNESTLKLRNCYVEFNVTTDMVVGDKTFDLCTGVLANSSFNRGDFSKLLKESNGNWYFESGATTPNLKTPGIIFNSMVLETENVKKTFYVGESFSFTNLQVHGLMNDEKTEFYSSDVIVDYSNFDSSYPSNDIVIKVKYYDKTFEYTVDVLPVEIERIYVIEKTRKTYYAGDTLDQFDKSTIEVRKIDNQGYNYPNPVPYNPNGIDGYKIELPGNKFQVGNNKLKIVFKGCSYIFNVDAKQHEVSKIEILNKEAFESKTYNVGTNDIDFSDIQARVTFKEEDSNPIVVGADELEFIYSRISNGENKVIVTYDVSYSDTLTLTGAITVDATLLANFTDAVSKINNNDTLRARFEAIKVAEKYYKEIGPVYVGDEAYKTTLKTFIDAKNKYNADVENINNGYKTAIEINTSINHTIVSTGGLITLAGILSWILKRI